MPIEQTTGLYIPTLQEFAEFKGYDDPSSFDFTVPQSQLTLFLNISADLLILRTGLKRAPDPLTPLGRMVSYGLMDLAWYLGTSSTRWTSMFSPFSSERLGSYTYSKLVSSAASKSDLLDAPLFDAACKALMGQEDEEVTDLISSGIGFSTEHVFAETYAESKFRDSYPGRFL